MTASERKAKIAANSQSLKVGDKINCVFGKECEIIKLNAKTVVVKGGMKVERHNIISCWNI